MSKPLPEFATSKHRKVLLLNGIIIAESDLCAYKCDSEFSCLLTFSSCGLQLMWHSFTVKLGYTHIDKL